MQISAIKQDEIQCMLMRQKGVMEGWKVVGNVEDSTGQK